MIHTIYAQAYKIIQHTLLLTTEAVACCTWTLSQLTGAVTVSLPDTQITLVSLLKVSCVHQFTPRLPLLLRGLSHHNLFLYFSSYPFLFFSLMGHRKKKRGSKKDALNEEERKRLSTMAEEDDEEDCGITIRIDAPTPVPSKHASPPRGQEALSQWQRDVRLTPDEPLGLFPLFPGRSFPLRPSPLFRRSPQCAPLPQQHDPGAPLLGAEGLGYIRETKGLLGIERCTRKQTTPAALSVATIASAALPENTISDGLHAGLRPGGARGKPVCSIASLQLCSTCALQMPP
ncbi:hypothetical protein MRX96_046489 [Rhipicephalus microplus]